GTTSSGGTNFTDDASCGLTGPTDILGEDAMLGALADNGGATATRLPAPGSPLIDAVPVSECSEDRDQRDVARPIGPACDIGAVEAPLPLVPDPVTPPVTPPATPPAAAPTAVVADPTFTG